MNYDILMCLLNMMLCLDYLHYYYMILYFWLFYRFAYIEFQTIEEAKEAITKMDNEEIKGRPLRVSFARSKKEWRQVSLNYSTVTY